MELGRRIVYTSKYGDVFGFEEGKFDEWMFFFIVDDVKYLPKDVEYFRLLSDLGKKHGNKTIYNDFVKIFNITDMSVSQNVIEIIEILSKKYKEDERVLLIWFVVLYLGMIAEENKKGKKLGKRIKRLGMHQVLVLGYSPEYAASYSLGRNWRTLDIDMKVLGF